MHINLPKKLINISEHAFENCYALKDIYASEGLKTINSYAFNNCRNLESVYYAGNSKNWNSITFGEYNIPLQNAEVEYGATGCVFAGYTQSKSCVYAKIRKLNGRLCGMIMLAVYDADGRLLSVTSDMSEEAGLMVMKLPFGAEQTARCFMWNEDMSPHITADEYEYRELIGGLQDVVLETPHSYYNGMNEWYTYSFEEGEAESIDVTFSTDTFTEGYDYIYIYDMYDNCVGTYSGSSLAGVTVNIPGNTVKIRFTTDGSVTYYGFRTESIYVNV